MEQIGSEIAPLKLEAYAVIPVGETSVILDTMFALFKEGASVEEIGDGYLLRKLSDIGTKKLSVIVLALHNKNEYETN